jgi:serine/threonine-protein kinase
LAFEGGQRISHYRLIEQIGEGAMGVVWRATDTALQRDVALKILPDAFSRDAARVTRFEREAKLLATLNHSGIATIHGLHQDDGVRFLAMEFVPGEDLAQRLARGPLAVDEALDVALQVAEALDAAHERGVIHRDLKPANIKITPEGQVKLLDFGLAKAFDANPAESAQDLANSATQTSAETVAGVILGTAAYMSPEQARGRRVDRRTDVWAFGCVLYEMLTGTQAFKGETASDTLAAILTGEPDWEALPADLPPRARRLLRRCLRKDVRRRLRDAGDARVLLEEAIEGADDDVAAGAPVRAATGTRWLPWIIALAALLAAVVLAIGRLQRDTVLPVTPRYLSIQMPATTRLGITSDRQILAISPDGKRIVFVGNTSGVHQLHLRDIDRRETRILPGTERARGPFFSPDGEWIAFFSEGKLKKLALHGGNPIDLCDAGLNRGGTWGADDIIVFAPFTNSGLMKVSATGGAAEPLTELIETDNERTHRWPQFLPDGRTVLFTIGTVDKPGDYEGAIIGAVSADTGERTEVYRGASMARYAPSGHLVVAREGVLAAVPFDAANLASRGHERILLQDVGGVPTSGIVYFDLARDGTLIYTQRDEHAKDHKLGWVDRSGRWQEITGETREYLNPRVSPDGNRLVFHVGPGEGRATDIWLYNLQRNTTNRLTFNNHSESPVWSPDGRFLAYVQLGPQGEGNIVRKASDGSGEPEPLLTYEESLPIYTAAWTSRGNRILFVLVDPDTEGDIHALSVETGDVQDVQVTPYLEWSPTVSPDGRWMAYSSVESGVSEVYVTSLDGRGGRWQVSHRGASPCWSRDGKELFYRDDTRMMGVDVETEPSFTHSSPHQLFEGDYIPSNTLARNYDAAPDGRFLMVRRASDEEASNHINVVIDWFAELDRAAPPD